MALYGTDNVLVALINRSSEGLAVNIPAPGEGKRIAVDYLLINANAGANLITLNGSISMPYHLIDNQEFKLENSLHNPTGIFPCDDNQAFTVVQDLAVLLEGYVLYRII